MILVTGINGFVGKHLASELSARGCGVVGIGSVESEPHPEIADLLDSYFQCDITKKNEVNQLPLAKIDSIINLAGLANVGASFDNPTLYMRVNTQVLSVLGQTFYEKRPNGRIIAVSSGALYSPKQSMPLTEESAVDNDTSPYSKSKSAMERIAHDFHDNGLDCIIVRPFNHIGPGQGPGFIVPDLAGKLKALDPSNPKLTVGNIKTTRDYTDVRDIVKAYADLATAPKLNHNLYNICSGNGQSGENILKELCSALNVDFGQLIIETDPKLIRPNDPQKIVGSSDRLQADTGWKPSFSLKQTVQDIVNSLQ